MPPPDLRIRPATPDDAERLVAYVHRLTNEPHNNIVLDPGQWAMTVDEERAFITSRNSSPTHGIFAVAEIGSELVAVGQLDRGQRQTNQHTATLGLSVDAAWRRRGIATSLMDYLIEWARREELVRIELKVFARNAPAIHVYERLGFAHEGRHPYAFLKQGVWVEELTM
ncbi:MAG TPA: GNAT family protein, partial [Tepidisphaeraceae bacterium]|nr:GNAT family protein [Tepidisphaeraceae bacterium]